MLVPTSTTVNDSESVNVTWTIGVRYATTVVATSLVPAPPAPARLSTIKYRGISEYREEADQTVLPELVTASKSA